MGYLIYDGDTAEIHMDDRTLAHLQIVICNKLRRNERFNLDLSPKDGFDGPATTLWFESSLPVRFTYSTAEPQAINTSWLYLLADAACSRTGLRLVPEPEQERAATAVPTPSPARRQPVPA